MNNSKPSLYFIRVSTVENLKFVTYCCINCIQYKAWPTGARSTMYDATLTAEDALALKLSCNLMGMMKFKPASVAELA